MARPERRLVLAGYVERHPEAWPVNEKGEKAPPATWLLGACPAEAGFKAYRLRQLEQLLGRFDVGGVWMDYLHARRGVRLRHGSHLEWAAP